jgi:hypothetical protein
VSIACFALVAGPVEVEEATENKFPYSVLAGGRKVQVELEMSRVGT